jgi:hypothetical protein
MFAWVSIIFISIFTAYYLWNRHPIVPLFYTTVTEPGAYSISYPSGWLREEQGVTSGSEILTLYSYNYRALEFSNQGLGPGQIKITVSILPKGVISLEQIVDNQIVGIQKVYRKQFLNIHDCQAIRISLPSKTGTNPCPRIGVVLDYSENQYALIMGYYNGEKTAAAIIRRIQESFKPVNPLKELK